MTIDKVFVRDLIDQADDLQLRHFKTGEWHYSAAEDIYRKIVNNCMIATGSNIKTNPMLAFSQVCLHLK